MAGNQGVHRESKGIFYYVGISYQALEIDGIDLVKTCEINSLQTADNPM